MPRGFDSQNSVLPLEEALAFAPIHKRHFGTAVGIAAALSVALFTTIDVLFTEDPQTVSPLRLLDNYFYGYTVSWTGVVVGALWAFFAAWVAGWFVAFSRNFVLALALFWVRIKANLQATNEFLDHI